MLWTGKVVEELMVTAEDKETELLGTGDVAESDAGEAVVGGAAPMVDGGSGAEKSKVAPVVVGGEVVTGVLGGNVLLDNERMDVRTTMRTGQR